MKAAKSKDKARVVSISLPPDMIDEVQEIAEEERRSVSEIIRESFRRYAAERALDAVRKEGRKAVKRMKLKPDDIPRIVREGRK